MKERLVQSCISYPHACSPVCGSTHHVSPLEAMYTPIISHAHPLRPYSLQPRTQLWKRWLSSTALQRAPCTFALRVTPSPSAFAAASSSTGAGFKSSARLACYRGSSAATSRVMSADEALHAPMKAAAAGSTPTPSRCSWTCSTAEEAARQGETARSGCSLDQLRGPPAMPLSPPLSPS